MTGTKDVYAGAASMSATRTLGNHRTGRSPTGMQGRPHPPALRGAARQLRKGRRRPVTGKKALDAATTLLVGGPDPEVLAIYRGAQGKQLRRGAPDGRCARCHGDLKDLYDTVSDGDLDVVVCPDCVGPEQKVVRRVRTAAGAQRYGQPIGTIITRDMVQASKRRTGSGSSGGGSSPSRSSSNATSRNVPTRGGTGSGGGTSGPGMGNRATTGTRMGNRAASGRSGMGNRAPGGNGMGNRNTGRRRRGGVGGGGGEGFEGAGEGLAGIGGLLAGIFGVLLGGGGKEPAGKEKKPKKAKKPKKPTLIKLPKGRQPPRGRTGSGGSGSGGDDSGDDGGGDEPVVETPNPEDLLGLLPPKMQDEVLQTLPYDLAQDMLLRLNPPPPGSARALPTRKSLQVKARRDDHSSSTHADPPNGPGTNWVEQQGHLPDYIKRVAKHVHADSGYSWSHAIASAVNVTKRRAASGNGQAAASLARWEAMKASSGKKRRE